MEDRISAACKRSAGWVLAGMVLLTLPASSSGLAFAQRSALSLDPSASLASAPTFEVTAVKRNNSGDSGSRSSFANGRFTATNISLKNFIQYQAYGIPDLRILGGPPWLSSTRFDIDAKTDDTITDQLRTLSREQRRLQEQGMFKNLLEDRFKFAAHEATQELPVYALVIGKKGLGPGLHKTVETGDNSSTSAGTGKFSAQGVTLPALASALTQELSKELGRVIIDKTGIVGRYDVAIGWTPEADATPVSSGTDRTTPMPDSGPSLFTAIQEQLGLKLEATKGPVQVLIIDHVEMPSEN